MSTTTISDGKAWVLRELGRARHDYVALLGYFVSIVAILAVVQVLGTAISRMAYPFTLEWMEGGMVDHVRVVLAGKPLYREPSFEWTPFIYPPFYYWVCAAFMKVFGVGLFAMRLVSTLSLAGSFALIGAFVRREIGGIVAPIVAVGLFAVTFKVTGAWVDLARVDALYLVLLLGGAFLARFGKSSGAAVACGLLLFLAFFTKQSGAAIAGPVLAATIWRSRRYGLIASAVFVFTTLGAIQWMDLTSDGWFRYYVFKVPSQHEYDKARFFEFLVSTLWRPMPLAVLFAILVAASGALSRPVVAFYLGTLVLAWFHGFSGMLHNGGFENALIPYCAMLAISAGIGLGWVLQQPRQDVVRRLQASAIVAIVLQFGMLAYDQRGVVPRKRDIASGQAMVERLKLFPRDFYSLGFGRIAGASHYGHLAGHEEIHAHSMALADIFKMNDAATNQRLLAEIDQVMASHRYTYVLWDESYGMVPANVNLIVRRYYQHGGELFPPAEADHMWPKTGFAARPNEILVPR